MASPSFDLDFFRYELRPFSKVTVKVSKREWSSILQRLRTVFTRAEILTVAKGYRDCATIHLEASNMKQIIEWCLDLGLLIHPVQPARKFEGWANKFESPGPNEPYIVFSVVARSEEALRKFLEAYYGKEGGRPDHYTIGKLLGYPECCVKFFCTVWEAGIYDPVWEIAKNTKNKEVKDKNQIVVYGYPECNILLRYFAIRAIPHLPCSFDCEASLEFAKKFLEFIPERNRLLELLGMDTKWDCYKGIAIIENEVIYGIANSVPYITKKVVYWKKLNST